MKVRVLCVLVLIEALSNKAITSFVLSEYTTVRKKKRIDLDSILKNPNVFAFNDLFIILSFSGCC